MKKFFPIIISLLLFVPINAYADDFFDDYTGIEQNLDIQKPVTDKEFEEVINALTEKQKKKEEKARKKKIKKISGGGTSLHKGLEPTSEILEQETLKEKDKYEGQLLNIPVSTYIDGKILEPGYYNVFGEKDEKGNVYLKFYQAHDFKGKVKAYTTKNDFDDDNIDFVKMTPYDENYIKVMYGSLDFNAYTYLQYLPQKP